MTTLLSDQDLTLFPDHLYYDMIVSNSHSINEDEPHLRFNERRSTALIQRPDLYKMSIIRFMCDTHSLPIMQPTIMSYSDQMKYFGAIDVNRTVYSITIQRGDDVIQEYVNFIPQDSTITVPSKLNADGEPDYKSGYYDIFTYEHFITMCNETIKSILSSYAGYELFSYPLYDGLPTFIHNTDSKISFQAPASNWSSNDEADFHIYINSPLYRLFNSIPVNFLDKKDGYGRNYQLDTYNYSNNIFSVQNYNTVSGPFVNTGGKDFYSISQEYSTTDNWSPVSSIAFTSSTLNVNDSSISSLHEYVNGREIVSGATNNTVAMITDIASPSNYLPGVYYAASVYRWIDLINSGPIKNINVEVFWVSKRAEFFPLKLGAGGTCTMKFLFQKKNI
jgi:hypothetical protein